MWLVAPWASTFLALHRKSTILVTRCVGWWSGGGREGGGALGCTGGAVHPTFLGFFRSCLLAVGGVFSRACYDLLLTHAMLPAAVATVLGRLGGAEGEQDLVNCVRTVL